MKHIKLALIQPQIRADRKENLNRLKELILGLAEQKPDLIVLPELQSSPYFCQTEDAENFELAENLQNGDSAKLFSELAAYLKSVIICSVFEKRAAGLYHNTAIVFERDGTQAGIYRKMHIPDDPDYYEKYYFTPGDLGFKPIETSIGKLGVLICWDQWFPESARLMALAGAEILIFPSAIGWTVTDTQEEKERQQQAWITVQRSHAIANGLPVISTNRTGIEQQSTHSSSIDFWGSSFVCDPFGKVIAHASPNKEEIVIAELDLSQNQKVRHIWPFLRDRRIDEYQGLLKRYLLD